MKCSWFLSFYRSSVVYALAWLQHFTIGESPLEILCLHRMSLETFAFSLHHLVGEKWQQKAHSSRSERLGFVLWALLPFTVMWCVARVSEIFYYCTWICEWREWIGKVHKFNTAMKVFSPMHSIESRCTLWSEFGEEWRKKLEQYRVHIK